MSDPINPLIMAPANKSKQRIIKHICTQEEQIEKMSLILVGNGHPEDGIAFKVMVMAKDFPEVKKDIDEIKRIVTNLSKSKTKDDAYEEGERDTVKKVLDKKDAILRNRSTNIMIGSLAIAFCLLVLGVVNLLKSDKILKAEKTVQFPTIDETTQMRGFPLDPIYHNDSLNPAPKYEFE